MVTTSAPLRTWNEALRAHFHPVLTGVSSRRTRRNEPTEGSTNCVICGHLRHLRFNRFLTHFAVTYLLAIIVYVDVIYIHIKPQTSPLVYHFAWGPMRAKPLLVGEAALRLEELLHEKAHGLGVVVRTVQIQPCYVYLAVEAPPTLSPHRIVCGLKAHSSCTLRREYKEMTTIPTLWTREYLVAAGEHVSAEQICAAFLATQTPRRPRGRPRCAQPECSEPAPFK